MIHELEVSWGDDVRDLFDKITLVTLRDVQEVLVESIDDLDKARETYEEYRLPQHLEDDYNDNHRYLMAVNTIIKYFGG